MTSPVGHNGVAGEMVRSIFQRWEKLEEEKRSISDDLKDLFAEAKANGFNGRALRAAFRHTQKMGDASERAKLETDTADFDLYVAALLGTDDAIARVAREAA